MAFFLYLKTFPPKSIFIWKFKKLNKNFFQFFWKFGCYCLLMQLNCLNTSPSPTFILNYFPLLATFAQSLLDNLFMFFIFWKWFLCKILWKGFIFNFTYFQGGGGSTFGSNASGSIFDNLNKNPAAGNIL